MTCMLHLDGRGPYQHGLSTPTPNAASLAHCRLPAATPVASPHPSGSAGERLVLPLDKKTHDEHTGARWMYPLGNSLNTKARASLDHSNHHPLHDMPPRALTNGSAASDAPHPEACSRARQELRSGQPPSIAVEVHGPRRPGLRGHADVVCDRLPAPGPHALGDGMLPREVLDGAQVLTDRSQVSALLTPGCATLAAWNPPLHARPQRDPFGACACDGYVLFATLGGRGPARAAIYLTSSGAR
jgi:hypothetical protein